MTIEVFAPAKVNLSLRVGPPRSSDGRHPLDSLVVFTKSVGDLVIVRPAPDVTLDIDGPFGRDLSSGKDNLILRAANLLRDTSSTVEGARIKLTKRLPVASGIGGGSADCAATLVALNQLWKIGASQSDLEILAARLGADVPACILGRGLHMTGTGETVRPLGTIAPLGIVLVNLCVPCSTADVFHHYDKAGNIADLAGFALPDLDTPASLLTYLRAHPNDLQTPAISLVPQIQTALSAIMESPQILLARMSGSGATCFGLYPTRVAAQAGAEFIQNQLASAPVWVEADEIT
jgi:4-diphosphocytidyl-2-C-methyl-D-erythritol kinase